MFARTIRDSIMRGLNSEFRNTYRPLSCLPVMQCCTRRNFSPRVLSPRRGVNEWSANFPRDDSARILGYCCLLPLVRTGGPASNLAVLSRVSPAPTMTQTVLLFASDSAVLAGRERARRSEISEMTRRFASPVCTAWEKINCESRPREIRSSRGKPRRGLVNIYTQ